MRGKLRSRVFSLVAVSVAGSVAFSLLVLTRADSLLSITLSAAVVGLVMGAMVSGLSLRWFDQLLQPLADTARRMQSGDLSVRAKMSRDEDVAQLGAAIDQLAGSFSRTVGELRDERDLVSRILDGMKEGVLLLDREGRVALTNPALREMLLLRADAIGQPLLEVVRHAELKELFDKARSTQATCSAEIELGGLKPRRLLVSGTSFAEHAGGLLAVFFDVTEIRRLESLRRDFVANVSHELRTPVTAVLSAAETLEMALDRDPEGARRFVGIIERNAARLQRLIEDLLDLSRIESRELKLRPERFRFEPFAQHVVGLFRDRADKKRIVVRTDVAHDVDVDCDRRALEQVITNLIDNAVKYCPDGSTVTVRAAREDSAVRCAVDDDGPGIDARHMPRLFERFYRVDAGRSREMGGTGLGLSICKHLVEAMGGRIEVRSAVGKGTTFDVWLPDASTRTPARGSSPYASDAAA
jgi:two-component system phosphate regulon sensor histidine kinase PhoR